MVVHLRRRHRKRLLHGLQIVAVCEGHGWQPQVSGSARTIGAWASHASSARWMAQSVACTMISSDMATPLLKSVAEPISEALAWQILVGGHITHYWRPVGAFVLACLLACFHRDTARPRPIACLAAAHHRPPRDGGRYEELSFLRLGTEAVKSRPSVVVRG